MRWRAARIGGIRVDVGAKIAQPVARVAGAHHLERLLDVEAVVDLALHARRAFRSPCCVTLRGLSAWMRVRRRRSISRNVFAASACEGSRRQRAQHGGARAIEVARVHRRVARLHDSRASLSIDARTVASSRT
jgi:hypothetical protein